MTRFRFLSLFLVAFVFWSCSSNDDEISPAQLGGTWDVKKFENKMNVSLKVASIEKEVMSLDLNGKDIDLVMEFGKDPNTYSLDGKIKIVAENLKLASEFEGMEDQLDLDDLTDGMEGEGTISEKGRWTLADKLLTFKEDNSGNGNVDFGAIFDKDAKFTIKSLTPDMLVLEMEIKKSEPADLGEVVAASNTTITLVRKK
ncbi:hypothetical protein FUAX_33410 [Fulvitalea axinellae]|uniref:Lipocalin-like domain-containing protein n=1 Tax=Fulvitalea axinellae TaxID=1182444 RepID=A0AAU9D8L5_9BACT|nr:hypothetical protein FUAX_33410 [Fulvitalea axinellae]